MASRTPQIAIIGGGLCGLALAIALGKRGMSYTIYELQSSFSEIGAGINIAPNAISAFNLIEPTLGDAVIALGTGNFSDPSVWMVNRLGAPTVHFPDAYLINRILSPSADHTTVGRWELLNLLASKIDISRARFLKKLVSIDQDDSRATLYFEDGTADAADIVIGCDGVHSAVRRSILGAQHPSVEPTFTGIASYRAVFALDKLTEVLGHDIPQNSCMWSGPDGCVVMYRIEDGKKVNIVFSRNKEDLRERLANERWVLKYQKDALLEDFKEWGPSIQKVMGLMDEQTPLWAVHHHELELDSYFRGKICIIGDAAHSMGAHFGQGASQAMEDAYVMAVVLSQITMNGESPAGLSKQTEAAFKAWQDVRKPQFEWLVRTSHAGFGWWANFWRPNLTEADMERRTANASEKLTRIWNSNVGRQGDVAKSTMSILLKSHR